MGLLPPKVSKAGLKHLILSLPKILSKTSDGITIYSLDIDGLDQNEDGSATLTGPVTSIWSPMTGWSADIRLATEQIIDNQNKLYKNGGVAVIANAKLGNTTHRSVIYIPPSQ